MNSLNFDPINLTQELVKCPSITPKDEGALDIVEKYLQNLGFKCERLLFSDDNSYGVENLFATIGNKGKHLAFAGHTDVVPPGSESSWKYHPFEAKIDGNKLYGRGVEDMKSNIASFISATHDFIKKNGDNFDGRISFIITGDEEKLAINGTKKIMQWADQNNIIFDQCIVGEPTSNKSVGDKIKIGRRGSISFFIKVKGIQGHTANSHRAENSAHYLTKLLNNIISNPLDNGNENFLPSSLQIATIDIGNSAQNIIPEIAKATINIRYNDGHTKESLTDWMQNKIDTFFNDYQNVSCSFTTEANADSFLTKKGYLTKLMAKSISEVTGQNTEPEFATDGGTSDARFIKDYCEVAELGIINKTLHKIDEFVFLEDIKKLKKIYLQIIENYFKKN
tara:strand:+ start:4034 stop:5215 length:1182 start_codon:yes stop_codon:yes gene_type:complete